MSTYYTYKTLEGDTWDSISLKFYNDEYRATDIMAINSNYITTLIFSSGTILKIPVLDIKESEVLPPWKRGTT